MITEVKVKMKRLDAPYMRPEETSDTVMGIV
jgi:hypothetical protein